MRPFYAWDTGDVNAYLNICHMGSGALECPSYLQCDYLYAHSAHKIETT